MARERIRHLGITIGELPTGKYNAITDVPGVLVGQTTLIADEPRIARTGVTVILPREGEIWRDFAPAGIFSFNGNGELTGSHWINEFGALTTPIALTNTGQVGTVHEALSLYGEWHGYTHEFALPVIGETYDGWLNDMVAMHVQREHVFQAIEKARSGVVEEGCTGGGTGMICHEFKGGTGTASRVISVGGSEYHVGALVQSNYGSRRYLTVAGVPVGQELGFDRVPSAWDEPREAAGSIIIILATDAPLLPIQCQRLARRATVGLARVGGMGHNGSGDIFLAFSTGNHILESDESTVTLEMFPVKGINALFNAAAEVVEEAILNSLAMAVTTQGYKGHIAHELPLDDLVEIMKKYRRL